MNGQDLCPRCQGSTFPEILLDLALSLTRELSLMEKRVKDLIELLATGTAKKQGPEAIERVFEEIQTNEVRKKAIISQLDELHLLQSLTVLDMERIARTLRAKLRELLPMLAEYIPETRHLIATLIDGGVVCRPIVADGRPGYEFAATGTYGRLLEGSNDGGGEQVEPPQLEARLASRLTFRLHGQALAA